MSYGGLPNNYNAWPDDLKKKEWIWERIYKLGRNSSDGGVRMMCEKLAAKVSKSIQLTKHDIYYLERLEKTKK
jgi:hypothetical protein